MKTGILSCAAASAFACVLAGCDGQKPEDNPDLYRSAVQTMRTAPFSRTPALRFYQTEEFNMTVMTHADGSSRQIQLLGCVTLDEELTQQDVTENRLVRATLIDEETRERITGLIEATKLSRVDWMLPENCHSWSMPADNPDGIPAAATPPHEKRDINQSTRAPTLVPI